MLELPSTFVFGLWRLDVEQQILSRSGKPIPLAPKELKTLAVLAQNSGRLVTKEELISRVWPDTFVGDGSLARNVSVLRKILGEGLIQTVSKKGYRFVTPVETGPLLPWIGSMPKPGLAVLPFANLTGDASLEYLIEGITEETIRGLGRVFGQHLHVVALASTLRYRQTDQTVQQIARALGVEYVLTGRVRKDKDALRLQLELVEARDATCVWIESFELGAQENRGLQKRIASRIARSLQTELLPSSPTARPQKMAAAAARQAYLSGRYYWNRRTEAYVRQGIQCFESAIANDPRYGEAYAWLAFSHIILTDWGVAHPKRSMVQAEDAAVRALGLDEGLSEAHVALAWTKVILHKDWAGAESSLLRAIQLNPSNPWSYHWYAYLGASQGRIADSLELNARAVALDPFSVPINSVRSWILYLLGDYEGAKVQSRATVELEPAHPGPHAYLAMAYQQLGEYEQGIQEMQLANDLGGNMSSLRSLLGHAYAVGNREAEANQIAAELEIAAQSTYVCAYYMAILYAGLRDYRRVAYWLLRSVEDSDPWVLYLKMDPRFTAFRSDRRFADVEQALCGPVSNLDQNLC